MAGAAQWTDVARAGASIGRDAAAAYRFGASVGECRAEESRGTIDAESDPACVESYADTGTAR